MTNDQYLKAVLGGLKLELNEIRIQHRINYAKFEVKEKMLHDQINSIERQLGKEKG